MKRNLLTTDFADKRWLYDLQDPFLIMLKKFKTVVKLMFSHKYFEKIEMLENQNA